MTKIFNEYFYSMFTTSDFTLPNTSQLPTPLVQLNNIQTDRSDVYEVLSNLDTTKLSAVTPYTHLSWKLLLQSYLNQSSICFPYAFASAPFH